jgi:hypothetical protein
MLARMRLSHPSAHLPNYLAFPSPTPYATLTHAPNYLSPASDPQSTSHMTPAHARIPPHITALPHAMHAALLHSFFHA